MTRWCALHPIAFSKMQWRSAAEDRQLIGLTELLPWNLSLVRSVITLALIFVPPMISARSFHGPKLS